MNVLNLFKKADIGSVEEEPVVTIQAFATYEGAAIVVHDPGEAEYFQVCAPLFHKYERVWVADFSLYEHAFVFAHLLSEKLGVPIKNLVGNTVQTK